MDMGSICHISRFHLNSRARWHDGKPVTASDVRFTFNLLRDSALGFQSRRHLAESIP